VPVRIGKKKTDEWLLIDGRRADHPSDPAVGMPEHWTAEHEVECPDCEGRKGMPPDSPCETCNATGRVTRKIEVCDLFAFEELAREFLYKTNQIHGLQQASVKADMAIEDARDDASRNLDVVVALAKRL
jgi:RecJ-like exonuclease